MPIYLTNKGLNGPVSNKNSRQKFLTDQEVANVLDAIIKADSPYARRDHAAVFLAYNLGLRITEVAILNRDTFRDLDSGLVHIRTLKQSNRIKTYCAACGNHRRFSQRRGGTTISCSCGAELHIPAAPKKHDGPPEKDLPAIEQHVIKYLQGYLNFIPKTQFWLFEGRSKAGKPAPHLSREALRKIFATYVIAAGLSSVYGFHSLRHGRGVYLWEHTENPILIQEMLRQQSPRSTEIYMHLSPKRAGQIAAKLDKENILTDPWSEDHARKQETA